MLRERGRGVSIIDNHLITSKRGMSVSGPQAIPFGRLRGFAACSFCRAHNKHKRCATEEEKDSRIVWFGWGQPQRLRDTEARPGGDVATPLDALYSNCTVKG